ncbi:MAG: HNH endonuclease signature motif containing protein [Rhodobacteraceae bacterium]|nr:HNH endonuclease signature motif containing protein [Paracoccaceae bacterium]MCY4197751.1 HNH endonuclease signature motif containing protein [Paracoccaceae bacterium]MCY4328131.1 HNH endonuclease signature motif containing protein [Paracoccaceae bacterium]
MRLASVFVTVFVVSLPGSSAQAVPPLVAPIIAVGGGAWTIYEISDAVCPNCVAASVRISKKAIKEAKEVGTKGKDVMHRTAGKWSLGAIASTPLRKHMPDLYKKQKGRDGLCGTPLPALYVGPPWNRRLNPAIEVDHIKPKAKGGLDTVENLQLTLGKYNRQKGDRPWGPRERQLYCSL